MSPKMLLGVTFDEGFQLWLLAFGDDGLFCCDFFDELINIGPEWGGGYSEERLRRSMDLVSTSPLLRTYSRRMPGG